MNYLLADLVRNITLGPGDVIFSGTPANSRRVESASDEVLSTAQGGDWEFRGVRPPRREG